nr:MAG TPA: hypothetical protein [Caudoviricetes sp.]
MSLIYHHLLHGRAPPRNLLHTFLMWFSQTKGI